MTIEDLKLELNKITIQQQQWHDEFIQRDKYWHWQKWIWLATVILLSLGIIFK